MDSSGYKTPTIRRRLHRRMALHKLSTLGEYTRSHETPGEVGALYEHILIHVTSFFREPDAFELVKTEVFPKVLTRGKMTCGTPTHA